VKVKLDFKNFSYDHLLIDVDGPPETVDSVIAAIRAALAKADKGDWTEV